MKVDCLYPTPNQVFLKGFPNFMSLSEVGIDYCPLMPCFTIMYSSGHYHKYNMYSGHKKDEAMLILLRWIRHVKSGSDIQFHMLKS